MHIIWSIPFPDDLPESVRNLILAKTESRWRRMTANMTDVVVELQAGSEWDPQEPEFHDLPGKKAEQQRLRKQLLQAASEIAQSVAVSSRPQREADESPDPLDKSG